MPANDGRHRHTTQRTHRTTLSAGAAALIMLAAAACTATTTGSATNSSPAPATTAAAASGPAMTLTGAGSTFDAPFFDLAFARYHQAHPSVTIRYSAVGSSAGIAAFTAQHADFGASAKVGTGKTLHWPIGTGAEGNPGVANAVAHIPFSIGYVERSCSKGPVLTYAAIRNRAGNYTVPSNASITADAAQKPDITPTDFAIVNEPGTDSYPISGYS